MLSGLDQMQPITNALPEVRPQARFRVSAPIARVLLDCAEFVAIVVLGVAAGVGYAELVLGQPADILDVAGTALFAAIFYASLRGLRRSQVLEGRVAFSRELLGVLGSWVFVIVTMSFIAFVMKTSAQYSRGFMLLFATSVPLALIAIRWQYLRLSRAGEKRRCISWNVVLLGTPEELAERNLRERFEPLGIDVVAAFPLLSAPAGWHGLGEVDLRTIEHMVETCRHQPTDEIMLVLPWREEMRIHAIVDQLTRVPLPVRLLADRSLESVMARSSSPWGPLASIEVQRAPLTVAERIQKRALDVTVAGTALALLMPLLILVALLIKLESKGPVLFKQRRNGFNGRVFRIYKFRSMTTADDGPVIAQATPNDTRVTRVGRWLRRSSIDELPQLWNVLAGDMSIVGPRPHAIAHTNDFNRTIADYALRHHMKPGLTGWAQVNGFRGETPHLSLMERRVEHDIWYINNWSIWLDIRIMLRTVHALLKTSAY